jgi:catechol 2,3-dioxygenase-like lactoylglutathione lyase family enzyme
MAAQPISELRVSITVDDIEAMLAFWRDGLGLAVVQDWDGPDGRGVVLAAGRATLELLDRTHARHVERIEAGGGEPEPVRLAAAVADAAAAAERLVAQGGRALAPVRMPWGDLNVRVIAPEGPQLTLFSPSDGS